MRLTVRYLAAILLLAFASGHAAAQVRRVQPGEADQTLQAMRDEMQRSRERLRLGELERPYFIEYRLLDLDVRAITASFGALLGSTSNRNRFMAVDVRVGDYQLDSSSFISDDSFQGFIGSTGTVGIDRDYDSLRQDLWLATDQAYKQAVDSIARKRAFLRSLARQPDIPDFSREQPVSLIEPLREPDWTNRNWEEEAKAVSAVFRNHPELYSTRVTIYLVYATQYLMTSEGSEVRTTRSLAAIEGSLESQSGDGMRLHHYYAKYAAGPAALPPVEQTRRELEVVAREMAVLRLSPPAPDYAGPVLFEPRAAGMLLAQMLGPSISGSRPALSMVPMYDQILERFGGRSEWSSRLNTRVLPASVTLIDDPTAREYNGQPLLGHYEVDEEGVRAQRVVLVEDGVLKNLLLSRRPGPEFQQSNGHGRATFLSEPRAAMSNVFFQSKETLRPEEMRKKFLDACRAEGREWCVMVRQMDNPAVAFTRQEDFSEMIAAVAAGAASGDRLPLLVYRVYLDGREELIRGARLGGLTLRSLRNIAAIGNDYTVYHFHQNAAPGFGGTALGAFSGAQGGLPSSIVAPSLLLDEVDVRGARGEPRRLPIVPAPPLK
ncbi:MAG TPA: metallopeptidase TldD-related protein [Candidatus Acidoferrales bacterium]